MCDARTWTHSKLCALAFQPSDLVMDLGSNLKAMTLTFLVFQNNIDGESLRGKKKRKKRGGGD